MNKVHLAIFASGSGSNARAIIEFFKDHPRIEIALILYNKKNAGVKAHADTFMIPNYYWSNAKMANRQLTKDRLSQYHVDGIILAGYLALIPEYLIDLFPDSILNIHPALLPAFGGKGMYGHYVHEAVSQLGHSETGITIHLVNKEYDKGNILFQSTIPIKPGEDPQIIANNVLKLEHTNYSNVICQYFSTRIQQ